MAFGAYIKLNEANMIKFSPFMIIIKCQIIAHKLTSFMQKIEYSV